ncbi:MAG: TlpA disulfide reductase family protein [Arachidicoccus sp.]|nr:TlpA disulfide reductase family protein [Arachidicoccus sp.]
MKKRFLLLALLPFGLSVYAQQHFKIIGKLNKVQYPAHAYVYYQDGHGLQFDSVTVRDNQFILEGDVSVPMKAFVLLYQRGATTRDIFAPDQVGVYLENGTIEIKSSDTLTHAVVGGTKLNEDQQVLINILEPFKKEEGNINEKYIAAEDNTDLQAKLKKQYEELLSRKSKIQINYIKNHRNSLVSLNLIRQSFDPIEDAEKAKMLINILSPDLRVLPMAQQYYQAIQKAKDISIGAIAPEFTMKDKDDKDFTLSSYRGKYILLDFWASWCRPCREENPNVLNAYNQYKNKNFNVIGVSLDGGENGKENWLKAIEKDNLSWEQLSDLQGANNAAARLYQVTAIPTNFLIDPSGIIIAKNLRGEALENKLKEILK